MVTDMKKQGLEVKIWLKCKDRTQRWLIDELSARGFENLTEQLVSSVLRGRYPYAKGREIMAAIMQLMEEDKP